MDLLFLSRKFPCPPHAGDLLFTHGLIEALKSHPNINLTQYYGITNEDFLKAPSDQIYIGANKKSKLWRVLFGRLPKICHDHFSVEDGKAVESLIINNHYDAILMNETSSAFFLPYIDRAKRVLAKSRPATVFISHNADGLIRPLAAKEYPSLLYRLVAMLDAAKYRRLERDVMGEADLFTAISEEDFDWFSSQFPNRRGILLKPGYDKPPVFAREITATCSPTVAIVGSFDWYVKQINLFEILDSAAALQGAKGLQFRIAVIGNIPDKVSSKIEEKYDFVDQFRSVTDVANVLREVRLAMVLERLGGGFKLKTLDYVFNRVPIIAYKQAVSGSNLVANVHYICVSDVDSAIARIDEVINDFQYLNRLQHLAFDSLKGQFDWPDRAISLTRALKALQTCE